MNETVKNVLVKGFYGITMVVGKTASATVVGLIVWLLFTYHDEWGIPTYVCITIITLLIGLLMNVKEEGRKVLEKFLQRANDVLFAVLNGVPILTAMQTPIAESITELLGKTEQKPVTAAQTNPVFTPVPPTPPTTPEVKK